MQSFYDRVEISYKHVHIIIIIIIIIVIIIIIIIRKMSPREMRVTNSTRQTSCSRGVPPANYLSCYFGGISTETYYNDDLFHFKGIFKLTMSRLFLRRVGGWGVGVL